MNNYSIVAAPRGEGKTSWMVWDVIEALWDNKDVAVLIPVQQRRNHLAHQHAFDYIVGVDAYSEHMARDHGRGKRYDHIFVDDANDFHDNPIELCARNWPGTPATFYYTPYPFEQ